MKFAELFLLTQSSKLKASWNCCTNAGVSVNAACNACNASWAVLVKSTKSNVECDGTNHRPRAR